MFVSFEKVYGESLFKNCWSTPVVLSSVPLPPPLRHAIRIVLCWFWRFFFALVCLSNALFIYSKHLLIFIGHGRRKMKKRKSRIQITGIDLIVFLIWCSYKVNGMKVDLYAVLFLCFLEHWRKPLYLFKTYSALSRHWWFIKRFSQTSEEWVNRWSTECVMLYNWAYKSINNYSLATSLSTVSCITKSYHDSG